MEVLQESPWYEEILRQGEKRGEIQGRKEQMLSNIEMSLDAKFGSQGLELMTQISQISDLQRLQEVLRSVVLASSVEEILQAL